MYHTMALCYYFKLYMMRGITENPFHTKTLQLQTNVALFAAAQTSTITTKGIPQFNVRPRKTAV